MGVNKYDQDEENISFHFSNYKRGLIYIKKYKVKLFIVFILNCISIIATLCITKILQYVIDAIIPNSNYESLFTMLIFATLLVLVSIILTKIYSKMLAGVNLNIVEDIKNDLFSHIQYLSFNYYDTRPHGKIFATQDDFINSITYLERILETMEEPIEIKDTNQAKEIDIKGLIEFKDVTFSYIEGRKVLDKLSFRVEPQEWDR